MEHNKNKELIEAWQTVKSFQRRAGGFEENKGVDLEGLSRELGIAKIIENDNIDDNILGGITRANDGKYYVVVNSKQPITRKRFTIAHELGHFILHRHIIDKNQTIVDRVGESNTTVLLRQVDSNGVGITNTEEIEANKMAADILMPFDKIKEVITKEKMDVVFLAKYFNVSLTSMAYRLDKPKEKRHDWFNEDNLTSQFS